MTPFKLLPLRLEAGRVMIVARASNLETPKSRGDPSVSLSYQLIDSRVWEGYRENRRCSRGTYPESYTTKYTDIREKKAFHRCRAGHAWGRRGGRHDHPVFNDVERGCVFWGGGCQPNSHSRGTLLMRNRPPLGSYSRTMPRAPWWPWGGGQFLVSEVPL